MADAHDPGSEFSASFIARLQERYGADEIGATTPVEASESGFGIGGSPKDALCPDSVERYAVGREIARGGMGAILEVWDQDLDRPLAMKVLLDRVGQTPSASLIQRFVREARITGQLNHPGIVPVHDLNMDESGRVFFTMLRIQGEELSKIVERVHDADDPWTESRALEVFLKVCDTVAFAHSRDVVHRDLKPANVMVGEYGEVYVLDWGLAKVVGGIQRRPSDLTGSSDAGDAAPATRAVPDAESPDVTRSGEVMGTPSYMAPEQAHGQGQTGDPRLDVYSIGAILYALLCGRSPYRGEGRLSSSHEILLAVRSGPPPSIGSLRADVPSGLVRICERAMARDPEARYSSAAEMASDMRRFLDEERKQAEETVRLRSQLADSERVSDFLKGLFKVQSPTDLGKPTSLTEILERGATGLIEDDLEAQPTLRASIHAALGEVHQIAGSFQKGLAHCQEAVDLTRASALGKELDRHLARRLEILAFLQLEVGEYAACEANFQEAAQLQRRLGETEEALASPVSGLGYLYFKMGRYEEARRAVAEALEIRRPLQDDLNLGTSLVQQAVIMNLLGDPHGAEAHYHEVIAMRERSLGRRSAMVTASLNNLGTLCFQRGDHIRAEGWFREAVEIRQETMGGDHPKTVMAIMNLASALIERERYDEAESLVQDCLQTSQRVFDEDHPDVIHAREFLGRTLALRGAVEEAEEQLILAKQLTDDRLAPENPRHVSLAISLAILRESQGRLEEAEGEYRRAMTLQVMPDQPLVPSRADATYRWGQFLARHDRADEARPILERCLAAYESCLRDSDPIVVECRQRLEELGSISDEPSS